MKHGTKKSAERVKQKAQDYVSKLEEEDEEDDN